MGDWRFMGQGMRRRMGAPMSHVEAANSAEEPSSEESEKRIRQMLDRTIRESGVPHMFGPGEEY